MLALGRFGQQLRPGATGAGRALKASMASRVTARESSDRPAATTPAFTYLERKEPLTSQRPAMSISRCFRSS